MNKKSQKFVFPIEKKLAAIEWNIELLKASVEITHTPVRTLKSIVHASVVLPSQEVLRKIVDSAFP